MAQRMPTPVSYEEWRELAGESTLSEWVDGEVVTIMPPKQAHFQATALLFGLLFWLVTTRRLGQVYHAPVEMRLARSAREPDIVYLATASLGRLDGLRVNGPADLAIEVISDDSVSRDRIVKFAEYEAAGVREYWIVDPREGRQSVEAWLLDGGRYRPIAPDERGRLASAVIPGFVVDPSWLEPAMLLDPQRALAEAMALLEGERPVRD